MYLGKNWPWGCYLPGVLGPRRFLLAARFLILNLKKIDVRWLSCLKKPHNEHVSWIKMLLLMIDVDFFQGVKRARSVLPF